MDACAARGVDARSGAADPFVPAGFSGGCLVVGKLLGRAGAVPTALFGAAAVPAGLLASASARSVDELIVSYGVVLGVGCAFCFMPAVSSLQTRFAGHAILSLYQGRKRVIQRRFNVGVLEAISERKAPTL